MLLYSPKGILPHSSLENDSHFLAISSGIHAANIGNKSGYPQGLEKSHRFTFQAKHFDPEYYLDRTETRQHSRSELFGKRIK